jgi:two-component system chemotaxis response regulator CheB
MPAGFTRSFVQRLDSLCAVTVHEAEQGQRVLPGHVYLAPGGVAHMKLARSGANYTIDLDHGEPVNRHRPSVDELFNSEAAVAGKNAVGDLLTGMGKDGAQGLLAMRQAGALTFAQDEASCVVFGMPREALHIGAAIEAVPLQDMSERILTSCGAYGHRV